MDQGDPRRRHEVAALLTPPLPGDPQPVTSPNAAGAAQAGVVDPWPNQFQEALDPLWPNAPKKVNPYNVYHQEGTPMQTTADNFWDVERNIPAVHRIPIHVKNGIKHPAYMKLVCGYCAVNNHESCKRGIRSGQGNIMLCPCGIPYHKDRAENEIQCTECHTTDRDELDERLWLCADTTTCVQRIIAVLKQNPNMQLMHEAYITSGERVQQERAARPVRSRNPSRPSDGKCLCCGEPTRGGLFLPGHDARLCAMKAEEVRQGADPIQVLAEFKTLGVSDALYAKLERKLEKL